MSLNKHTYPYFLVLLD